jgi:phospholipid transport system substrate-binding protein
MALIVPLLLLVGHAAPALAQSAIPEFRTGIERVFDALGNPAYAATERRQAVHALTVDLFDWPEMARRLLGNLWDQRTSEEREQFVGLLARMIDAQLLSFLPSGVEQIVWNTATPSGGDRVSVQTTVVPRRGREFPVEYRLAWRDDRWRVYDVVLGASSLVDTYRAQFRHIVKTASYEALIDKLSR